MTEDTTDTGAIEVRLPRWVLAVNLGQRRAGAEKLLAAMWTWKRWGTACAQFVFPSVKALASITGRSVSTVEGRLEALASAAWILRATEVVAGKPQLGWWLAWRVPGHFDPPPAGSGSPADGGSCPPPTEDPATVDGGSDPPPTGPDQEKIKKVHNLKADQAPAPVDSGSTVDGGPGSYVKLGLEILALVQSHRVSWQEAQNPTGSWCEDLAKAVPRLGLTAASVSWLLDEWARQRDERRELGTFAADVDAGRFPPLRGLWWERRRERQWVEAQLGRYERARAPARPELAPADPGELRDSSAVDELRRKLRGEP